MEKRNEMKEYDDCELHVGLDRNGYVVAKVRYFKTDVVVNSEQLHLDKVVQDFTKPEQYREVVEKVVRQSLDTMKKRGWVIGYSNWIGDRFKATFNPKGRGKSAEPQSLRSIATLAPGVDLETEIRKLRKRAAEQATQRLARMVRELER
jgi:hypothetical protein